jgi:predicted GIY-YIG superfamily endonuclease/CDGSH-type Zn-finger protein
MYYLYILECADQTLYTGITTDLKRRIGEHNDSKLGAKYTAARRPVKLVYSRKFKSRSTASKAEAWIKKLTKSQKIELIKNMQKEKTMRIKVEKNGPDLVFGNVPLIGAKIVPDADDYLLAWKETGKISSKETYALCRCGKTKTPPFCDGAHVKAGFKGRETADNILLKDKAKKYVGEELILLDAQELCASGHFCTRAGGTWELVEQSGDPQKKRLAKKEVADCPAGRLVLLDKKTGREIEPKLDPSITLIEDMVTGTSGPLWVRGRIPIESADGKAYELRNRVTLCRCGKSRNMPFCDSAHVSTNFQAGE